MASFPQNQFQELPSQSRTQQSKPLFRDLYETNKNANLEDEAQILQQVTYFNNTLDHHHPLYIPPFQVAGLAPGLVQEENGLDLDWGFGFEPNRNRPKEQVFLENNNNNNSTMLEFLQTRSVSTGLGLSLDNPPVASSGDSALIGLVGDDFNRELQRQDYEIDRYVKLQGDRLRQAILEKFQRNQLQTISYIENKAVEKLREKEMEIEIINKKNMELELEMEQLALEASSWQQRAKYTENMINTLKHNLQQIYAQSRYSKEGCGDSEIEDTASCFKNDGYETDKSMMCKVCRVKEVCMFLLPCKHLCLCKDCEGKMSLCPICQTSKYIGVEVYRS